MKQSKLIIAVLLTMLFSGLNASAQDAPQSEYASEVKKIIEAERGTDLRVKSSYLRFDEKGNRKEYLLETTVRNSGSDITMAVNEGETRVLLFESSGYGVKASVETTDKKSVLKSDKLQDQILDTVLTYEDLAITDYTTQHVGAVVFRDIFAGDECLVLSLRPVSRNSRYSRLIIWAGVKDHLIRRIDYYEKGESTTTKRMAALEVKEFKGKKYRHKEEWVNFNDNRKALVEVLSIAEIEAPPQELPPVESDK